MSFEKGSGDSRTPFPSPTRGPRSPAFLIVVSDSKSLGKHIVDLGKAVTRIQDLSTNNHGLRLHLHNASEELRSLRASVFSHSDVRR